MTASLKLSNQELITLLNIGNPGTGDKPADRLTSIATAAVARAGNLAADTRYSHDHKAAEISAILDAARAELEAATTALNNELEKAIAAALASAAVPVVPLDVDAAALNYALTVLQAQWQTADREALLTSWRSAIAAGDKVSAKVYADALPAYLQREAAAQRLPVLPHHRAIIEELTAATVDLLRSAAQREAASRLAARQQQLSQVATAARAAGEELRVTYDRQRGQLVPDVAGVLGRRAF